MSARYAVYYVPEPGSALARFGAETLGYDAASGLDARPPAGVPFDGWDWPALTDEPRRYGFHATLKAPFHLRDGSSEATLLAAAADFAEARHGFAVPRLEVALLGRFVALVPAGSAPALDELGQACVREFDPFRAPLSEADRQRRLASPLLERQRAYLDRWGYPYVFDAFRFHMTLTGSLPESIAEPVRDALADVYAGLEPGLAVDAVTIARQEDRASRFRVLVRLPFRSRD